MKCFYNVSNIHYLFKNKIMKENLILAKLSQLSFSEIKALKELMTEDFDNQIKLSVPEDAKSLQEEKDQILIVIYRAISTKITQFLDTDN